MSPKLEALLAECGGYKQEVQKVINEERYTYREENISLNLLNNELNKFKNWIIELLRKIENSPADLSWKQFLQREKII